MVTLDEYVEGLYGCRDDLLSQMIQEAEEAGLPSIHIPDEIGRLLQVLIISAGASRILELGTLFGYSTVWMGRALPHNGRIVSLEAQAEHVRIARANLARAGLQDRVEVMEGKALDLLPRLNGPFDLVFIDADKVNYANYLDAALRLTRTGSLIVADNTWRRGEVATQNGDENARAMGEFNRELARSPMLLSTIIPTRGGGDALSVAAVR